MKTLRSPALYLSDYYVDNLVDAKDRCWLCTKKVAYHLGLERIEENDRVWFVASTRKPRGHSFWKAPLVFDIRYSSLDKFIERAKQRGCRYFWLEWEGSPVTGRLRPSARLRPFARRLASTARPPWVRMRFRKLPEVPAGAPRGS